MMNNKDYYSNTYIPSIVRIGKITCYLGAAIVLLPALFVTLYWNIVPEREALVVALTAQISINAVWWFVEPISFFPVLGVPGTYMAFLSGNIGNLRIPCASAALKATDTKPSTPEASIISSIGCAASIIVNIVFLCVGVFAGSNVIGKLPDSLRESFNYLLPAMFGALMMQFAMDDIKSGIAAIFLASLSMVIYKYGGYNWFPIDPFVPNLLVPLIGTALFAKITFKDKDT